MHQLNASIEAVVRSGLFVPMSKCARMLVLFLGLFLFMNSQINLISSQEFFDLDREKIQKNSTSSRSTPVITDFSVSGPELGDGTSPSSRAWFSLDETDTILLNGQLQMKILILHHYLTRQEKHLLQMFHHLIMNGK